MTNNEILRELEKSMELEGLTEGTLKRYTANIQKLMKYYEGKKISSLTEEELRGHERIATTEGYIHSKEIEHKIKSPVIKILEQGTSL